MTQLTYSQHSLDQSLQEQGYYLANLGQQTEAELWERLGHLGKAWHPDYPTMVVEAIEGGKFVAQMDVEITPHNECAYDLQPPRYLALFCEENTVEGGDFYLLNGKQLQENFSEQQKSTIRHTLFRCDMGTGFHYDLPLIRTVEQQEYLIYTSIGHTPDWQANHHYQLLQPDSSYATQIIPQLHKQLQTTQHRQYHQWKAGDLLVFNNLTFLHGRDAFQGKGRKLLHFRIR